MKNTLAMLVETSRQQSLSFLIAGQTCAIDVLRVQEIVYVETLTRVPNVHACIRGVVNLRGSVIPVIDVARGLGLTEGSTNDRLCLIVVETRIASDTVVLGLVVDEVREAFYLDLQHIEPAPGFGTSIPASFLTGIVKRDGAFVSLLDVDLLLGESSLFRDGAGGAA